MATFEAEPVDHAPEPKRESDIGALVKKEDRGAVAAAVRIRTEVLARHEMAMQRPRDEVAIHRRILEACKRPSFAKAALYSKPVGGKPIKGLSIKFADEAAKLYGNLHISCSLIYESDEEQTWKVTGVDLETNFTAEDDFTITKTVERRNVKKGQVVLSERVNSYGEPVFLVEATEDEVNVKRDAMFSKKRRAIILRLIPGDITAEALDAVTATINSGESKDPMERTHKMYAAFADIGVTVADIGKLLGRTLDPKIPLTTKDFDVLTPVFLSIRNGEARWSEYVDGAEDSGSPKPVPTGTRSAKKSAEEPAAPKDQE